MPTIIQTINGKVTGLWGSALRRTLSGKLITLKMGDLVTKGDVILTTQDGIVQLSPDPDAPPAATAAAAPSTDIDRVIAELNQPDARTAPAAGLTGGDGSGLQPGLRVERIGENISAVSFAQANDDATQRFIAERTGATEGLQTNPAPANATPNATPATTSGNEDAALPISLAGQDSDGTVASVTVTHIPAGSTLLLADGVTLVVAGQTLTPAQAATLLFSPAPDFNGGTAVTFTVTDNQGSVSAPATVQINVLSVNDAPVASAEVATTAEDTALSGNLLTNDRDVDGPALAVTQFSVNGATVPAGTPAALPGVGTLLINTDGSYTFTPAADYNGPVPVATYTVSDGSLATTSTLSISVGAVNDAPQANDDVATTAINTPVTIAVLANDSDADGDLLVVSNPVLANPALGTVSVDTSGQIVFTPANNISGPVQITYTVTDTSGASDTATVLVNVGNNTPPTGSDSTRTLSEDSSYTLQAGDFGFADADLGQSFANVRIDTLPAGALLLNGNPVTAGQLIPVTDLNAGLLVFTPAADANGAPLTALTFSVQDSAGTFDTAPHTLAFNVTPVNDATAANPDTVAAVEDTPVTFDPRANDTDVDGPALSIVSVGGQPIAVGTPVVLPQGTVSLNPDGTLTFTPAPHFNGPVNVPYTVTDGSTPAGSTVTLEVAPVNDAPVAGDDSASTPINNPVLIDVKVNDTDVDDTQAQLTVSNPLIDPGMGTVTVDPSGQLLFTPATNVSGAVSITYTLTDAAGLSDTATVTVNVGSNTPPVGADAASTVAEDTGYTLATADFGFADSDAGQTFAAVRIDSLPANGQLLLNGSAVAAGTVVTAADVAAGQLQFMPAADANGAPYGSFTFSVQDSAGAFDAAPNTFTLNVTPVNDAPAANPDTVAATEDTPVTFDPRGNDTDVDGPALAITQVAGQPIAVGTPVALPQGTISLNADGTLTFTPAQDFNGPVSIPYTVSDASTPASSTITVNVAPAPDAPVISGALAGSVTEDGTLTSSSTLTIADPDAGESSFVAQPGTAGTYGSFTLSSTGTWVYTLNNAAANVQALAGGDSATESFTITTADGSTRSVVVTVNGANDVPVAVADTGTATEDMPLTGGVLGNDSDVDTGSTLAVTQFVVSGTTYLAGDTAVLPQGSLSIAANGSYTFTPAANYNGAVPVATYTVSDGAATTTSTLTLTVTAVNDAPVGMDDSATLAEDSTRAGNVIGNDTDDDGDTLTVTQFVLGGTTYAAGLTATLAQGSLRIDANGDYSFTPAANYNGPVPVATYTLTDGSATSTATLTLAVTPVNDAPVAGDDVASTTINTPVTITVLGNDSDVDGDTLTVSNPVLADPAQGTVRVDASGQIVFTPANNISGPVQITYTVTDASGASDTADVLVNVGTNTPPTGADTSRSFAEDTSYTVQSGDFGFADADAGQALINVRIDAVPAAGTLLLNGSAVAAGQVVAVADIAAGNLVFVPVANGNGAPYASFSFSVQDSAGAFDTAPNTITLNVTPVADAAVITPDVGAVTEDVALNGAGQLTTGGTLNVVDPDAGEASFQPLDAIVGTFGSFTLAADGVWAYVAENSNPAIQALAAGQTLTETFWVQSIDGTVSSVTMTIHGTDDVAVISAATSSVTEDVAVVGGNIATSGTLTVSDVDAGQASFEAQASTAGTYGTFTLGTDGAWTYTATNGNPAIQALGAGQTLTETFTVRSADGTASSVVVTINGTNDVAVISAGTGSVTEDVAVTGGNITTGGTLTVTDADAGQATFEAQASTAGAYGTFTLGTDGAWAYTAANSNPTIQALGAGQTLTETFTVRSADGSTSSVVVTINGTNDVAVISAGTGSVTEDVAVTGGNLTTGGTLTITDTDAGQASFQAQASTAGTYGTFTLGSNGAWDYTAANANPAIQALGAGQTLTEAFTVRSTDGTTSSVVVTINGTNDVAVISAGTGSVTEDVAVTGGTITTGGMLTVTDADAGQASFEAQASTAGAYGTFTLGTDGAWTYAAENSNPTIQELGTGQTLTETFTVRSMDGTTSSVVVTINGTNDVAVISAGTGFVTEDVAVSGGNIATGGTLTVTDADAGESIFQAQASTAGTYGNFTLAADGAWTYAATNSNPTIQALGAGQTLTETFTVRSADGSASSVVVTINGTNDVAVISAGTGGVTEDIAVVGGNIATGGAITVTDTDAGQATFEAQASTAGAYGTFTLGTNGAWTYSAANSSPAIQALGAGHTLTETFTVRSADGTTSSVVVTINGTNDVAVISAGTGSVTEDVGVAGGSISTGGTLTVSDTDAGQSAFQAQASTAGTYGTFTLGTNGAWTYVAANSSPAIQTLGAGQTLTETFTVRSADGTTSSVVVTINGTNDVAVISAGTGSVTEDVAVTGGNLTTGGTLTITDTDASQATFQAQASTAGTYGTFTLGTNGAWTYTAANSTPAIQALGAGQTLTETFTVRSADGTTSSVVVTINGTNDVAVISGSSTGAATEAGGVGNGTAGAPDASGTLAITDDDTGQASFQAPASLAGTYGTFTFNAGTGAWTYALDNTRTATQALNAGQVAQDTLTVTSADGSATRIINVTVNGSNDNATITGTATGTITEAGGVDNATAGTPGASGTLTVADVDAGEAAFQTPPSLAGTYGTFTFNATTGAWTYTLDDTRAATQALTAGQVAHDTLSVASTDGTATRTIDVTVTGTNDTAVIGGTATGSVAEEGGVSNGIAGTASTSGTLTLADVDAGEALFQTPAPATLNGTYGSFTFNATTGAWTYTLDNTRTATQALTDGQTAHDTLTVTSSDGSATRIIDVTATGANDTAVISGTATGSVTEDLAVNGAGNLATGGTLAVTDVDTGEASFQAGTTAGTYGSFVLAANGTWTYTAANNNASIQALGVGQTLQETFVVRSADGTSSNVVVTTNGTNDLPAGRDVTVTANEDTPFVFGLADFLMNDEEDGSNVNANGVRIDALPSTGTLFLNGVLVTAGQVITAAQITAGQLSFVPNPNDSGTAYATLTFSVQDSSGGFDAAPNTVTLDVTPVNDAPVGVNDTATTAEETPISGNVLTNDTDVDSASRTVTQFVVDGTTYTAGTTATLAGVGTLLINADGSYTFTPAANYAGTVPTATYTLSDGSLSSTATLAITVTPVNNAPVATGASVSGTEDTALVLNWANFGVSDVDTAAASLGIRVATLPADGILQAFDGSSWVDVTVGQVITKATVDAGSLRFVPDVNESGSDSYAGAGVGNQQADYAQFTFTPNDSSVDGATATVRIDLAPMADTPTLTHDAAAQVTGSLSSVTSVGLTRDYYQAIATLTSGPSSTNPDTGETGIETAVPTSSSTITNVGVAGNLTGNTGVQVAADEAHRVQGLIYMEAGASYTFSGYSDDTMRLEIGGNTLVSGQWGGGGQATSGTFTSSTFTPTVTGYYSLEFMVYNTSGPGSYDLNVSVNGATAVDVSTANFLLYQSITQVDSAGGQRSAFVPNSTSGEGGYYPVAYDTSVQSKVYLAPVLANLADTDGSETLTVQMQNIPVGAVLTDGTNTFTATVATTSVDISSWDRSALAITLPTSFSGSTSLTAVATATETATASTAVTSVTFPVTVDPSGLGTSLSEIATFNADALIGQAGTDVYTVTGGDTGTGMAVAVTQGAAGSIAAQSGTETTGTIDQAFSTGAGNDYVQSGAGDDTIYLGDTGTATTPTTAVIAATHLITQTDAQLTDNTGLFANTALRTSQSDNTSVATWADVANAGSGDDVVYGQNGTDLIYGSSGNDYLNGGAGNDGLRGGAGNDTLVGGAGNDVLRGDAGADVFRWELADKGTAGTPAADIITDFNTALPSAGGDVLDLRDLLQGEASAAGAPGNLDNYLHFSVSGGNTLIQISSSGGFSGGFNASATDQSITLQGVDLTSAGAFGTDQQIIQDLLSKSKLLVDGS